MFQSIPADTASTVAMAVDIIASYVSNNPIPASELPALIAQVHGALAGHACGDPMSRTQAVVRTDIEKPTPVQIRRSVRRDGIVSFIDGKTYKTLKRHLTAHGLHPQSYRERYGLPADYPMVTDEYAECRSKLAKQNGLGRPGFLAERRSRQAA